MMNEISSEERLKAIIAEAVKSAIDERAEKFYIPSEKHYQDHMFLEDLISWTDEIKATTLRTIVKSFVTAIIILIVLGFAWWTWNCNK